MSNYNGLEIERGSQHTFTETTPLVFQWLPRNDGDMIPEEKLNRVFTWAKLEDTRLVYLVINGSGFNSTQREELEKKLADKKLNPNQNVQIIDFNELNLSEHDFSFYSKLDWKTTLNKYTFSKYFRTLYSIPAEERVSFAVEIDSMRNAFLLALLSSNDALIYLDLDVFPKNGSKLGEVSAKQGFLLAENDKKSYNYSGIVTFENAIMAVSQAGKNKLLEIHTLSKERFEGYYPLLKQAPHYIYTIICDVITYTPLQSKEGGRSQFFRLSFEDSMKLKEQLRIKTFGFQANGGNVDIQYEHSWQEVKPEFTNDREVEKASTSICKLG